MTTRNLFENEDIVYSVQTQRCLALCRDGTTCLNRAKSAGHCQKHSIVNRADDII